MGIPLWQQKMVLDMFHEKINSLAQSIDMFQAKKVELENDHKKAMEEKQRLMQEKQQLMEEMETLTNSIENTWRKTGQWRIDKIDAEIKR